MPLKARGRHTVVLALAGVLIPAAGCARESRGVEAPAASADAGPVVTLTAEQLAREYETDRAAADGKYKDRCLVLEGPVEDFDLFPSGRVLARVAGRDSSIRCEFVPQATARLIDLTRGQSLKFQGRCAGAAGNLVDLTECQLLEVGPDPAVAVSAVRLTRDYAGDEKAADAKYREKCLVVEGTVRERRECDKAALVVLEGFDEKALFPLRVVAKAAERKEEFAGLKKGDRVKVRGECGGNFLGEVRVAGARLVR
jgi:hypothetical protein